jgi:hypothetical protein
MRACHAAAGNDLQQVVSHLRTVDWEPPVRPPSVGTEEKTSNCTDDCVEGEAQGGRR